MTGLARNEQELVAGRVTDRLYRLLSRFLMASLVVGPILLGIWFASSAIEDVKEDVKPPEPLPTPKLAPLPKFQSESETPAGQEPAKVNLVAGQARAAQLR
jgi:hypothetical protein